MKKATKGAVTKTAREETAIAACGPLPPHEARPADDSSKVERSRRRISRRPATSPQTRALSRGEKMQALEYLGAGCAATADCEQ